MVQRASMPSVCRTAVVPARQRNGVGLGRGHAPSTTPGCPVSRWWTPSWDRATARMLPIPQYRARSPSRRRAATAAPRVWRRARCKVARMSAAGARRRPGRYAVRLGGFGGFGPVAQAVDGHRGTGAAVVDHRAGVSAVLLAVGGQTHQGSALAGFGRVIGTGEARAREGARPDLGTDREVARDAAHRAEPRSQGAHGGVSVGQAAFQFGHARPPVHGQDLHAAAQREGLDVQGPVPGVLVDVAGQFGGEHRRLVRERAGQPARSPSERAAAAAMCTALWWSIRTWAAAVGGGVIGRSTGRRSRSCLSPPRYAPRSRA